MEYFLQKIPVYENTSTFIVSLKYTAKEGVTFSEFPDILSLGDLFEEISLEFIKMITK